mmetsp:Transcript_49910/g.106138  ORF Transcript_49910/g.106138 Transcript_49910/m.106138 type:complete len:228 (+) Transcript_49910:487-1170(+)
MLRFVRHAVEERQENKHVGHVRRRRGRRKLVGRKCGTNQTRPPAGARDEHRSDGGEEEPGDCRGHHGRRDHVEARQAGVVRVVGRHRQGRRRPEVDQDPQVRAVEGGIVPPLPRGTRGAIRREAVPPERDGDVRLRVQERDRPGVGRRRRHRGVRGAQGEACALREGHERIGDGRAAAAARARPEHGGGVPGLLRGVHRRTRHVHGVVSSEPRGEEGGPARHVPRLR